jgi:hypothetical protein
MYMFGDASGSGFRAGHWKRYYIYFTRCLGWRHVKYIVELSRAIQPGDQDWGTCTEWHDPARYQLFLYSRTILWLSKYSIMVQPSQSCCRSLSLA